MTRSYKCKAIGLHIYTAKLFFFYAHVYKYQKPEQKVDKNGDIIHTFWKSVGSTRWLPDDCADVNPPYCRENRTAHVASSLIRRQTQSLECRKQGGDSAWCHRLAVNLFPNRFFSMFGRQGDVSSNQSRPCVCSCAR